MLDPLPMTEAVGHCLLEAVERPVDLAQDGVGAGHVVEHARIIRIQSDSAVGELQCPRGLALCSEVVGAEVHCPRVVGIELEVTLYHRQVFLPHLH